LAQEFITIGSALVGLVGTVGSAASDEGKRSIGYDPNLDFSNAAGASGLRI
jgi:hypothetical protein